MTREKAKEWIEIIQHYVDGGRIETRLETTLGSSDWMLADNPSFNPNFQHRIPPNSIVMQKIKPIDYITTGALQITMAGLGFPLSTVYADIVIDVIEFLEERKGNPTIAEIEDLKEEIMEFYNNK